MHKIHTKYSSWKVLLTAETSVFRGGVGDENDVSPPVISAWLTSRISLVRWCPKKWRSFYGWYCWLQSVKLSQVRFYSLCFLNVSIDFHFKSKEIESESAENSRVMNKYMKNIESTLSQLLGPHSSEATVITEDTSKLACNMHHHG